MANIRLLYRDVSNFNLTSLTATSTAGSLVATNVLTDLKSQVWRSTSGSCELTYNWSSPRNVNMVAVPFCTIGSTTTIRVAGYTNIGDAVPVFDSGTLSAAAYRMPNSSNLPTGVNSYSQGSANQAVVYVPVANIQQLTVHFTDPVNSFVEVGRVVIGTYWEPTVNVPYGSVTMGMGDDSKHIRSDAGDIFTDAGPRYKTLDFNFQYLPTADRDNLWRILRGNGMNTPVFIDVVPGTTDTGDEFIYSIYGKLAKSSSIVMTMFNQYASTLSWTEI